MADYDWDYSDWKFDALRSAQYKYRRWEEWTYTVDEGWSPVDEDADWVVCLWCAGVFYNPIRALHRTKCISSLEEEIPTEPTKQEIKEYQLDIPWKSRSRSNRQTQPWRFPPE